MLLQEAIILARQGIKMTHRYFTNDEWMILRNNIIVFEDGAQIFLEEWIEDKEYLNDGWSIYKPEEKEFFRVCNLDSKQGLWYDHQGNFTGNIHNKFNFCTNCNLEMEFDSLLVNYLSATPELESLYQWFTKDDILKLQEYNYFIHKYKTIDYKFYEKFNHWVINKDKSIIVEKITL